VTGTDEIRTVPTNDETISPETMVSVSPNPFNPQTKISFKLDQTRNIQVSVYDIRGRCVATLAEGIRAAGAHSVVWKGKDQTGRNVPSGTYFFRVDTGGTVEIVKAVLLK
jgi:flagellar hook assembly protein FlgD